jgi:hypothetical protein
MQTLEEVRRYSFGFDRNDKSLIVATLDDWNSSVIKSPYTAKSKSFNSLQYNILKA